MQNIFKQLLKNFFEILKTIKQKLFVSYHIRCLRKSETLHNNFDRLSIIWRPNSIFSGTDSYG